MLHCQNKVVDIFSQCDKVYSKINVILFFYRVVNTACPHLGWRRPSTWPPSRRPPLDRSDTWRRERGCSPRAVGTASCTPRRSPWSCTVPRPWRAWWPGCSRRRAAPLGTAYKERHIKIFKPKLQYSSSFLSITYHLQYLKRFSQRKREVCYGISLHVLHPHFQFSDICQIGLQPNTWALVFRFQSKPVVDWYKQFSSDLDEALLEAGHHLEDVVGEGQDVDEVVVAQRVEDVADDVACYLPPHASHGARVVDQDEHVLGAGGRLDVPGPGPAVVQVHGLLLPLHGCGAAHKVESGERNGI